MKKLLNASALIAACALPALSLAESNTSTPAISGSTAIGRVDFMVVVPAVLFLRIGTGGTVGSAANTTVDSLVFTVPAANVGDGTAIASSAASGDLTNGVVTVRVFSNFGSNVTLNSNVTGALTSVGGDTIAWSQIAVVPGAHPTPTAGFTNTGITHPAFSATTGNGTATTLTSISKLVRQEGKWTFTYSNAAVVPAGAYGTSARNGRVTYTAAQV